TGFPKLYHAHFTDNQRLFEQGLANPTNEGHNGFVVWKAMLISKNLNFIFLNGFPEQLNV
ncbi:MAG: hypothetical protein O3C43_22850, partial [Verrucomicrobia bacterium]|nr:hypothetical protein [Verrucomicrobiota bacterium]